MGEPRIVAECARFLETQMRPYYILNKPFDPFDSDQLEENVDRLMNAMSGYDEVPEYSEDDILEHYIPHAANVIFSIEDIPETDDVEAILDLSIATAEQKISMVQEIAEEYPGAIIYSSTLTCTATEINAMLPLSAQVVGFNGMPGFSQRKSIEIAPSLRTRDITHTRAKEFFTSLGLETEMVQDRVGLVMFRILAMLINEAAFAVMENVASPQDIDTAMKLGVNYPKGLLEWADEIGIDVVLSVLDALYAEYKQERYRACVLLKNYVHAGWLGKENGQGFYSYMPVN